MLSFLRQLGVNAVLEDSSGNGGASVAAYGAAGGMRRQGFSRLPIPRLRRSPRCEPTAPRCSWSTDRAKNRRTKRSASPIRSSTPATTGSRSSSQGTKSIAYELWEDFDFEAPDNIIIPVGAGATCSVATSDSRIARRRPDQRSFRGCSRPSRSTARRSTQVFRPASILPCRAPSRDHRRGHRHCAPAAASRNDLRLEGSRW